MASLVQQLREVSEAVEGRERYQDLAIALRRAKTSETLLFAGGRWDRLGKRFCDEDPERVAVIDLEESQVEFTLWFAEFLADFRDGYPRDVSLALAAGDRRGGKTFDTYYCQIAALIDVPKTEGGLPTVGWTISRTYRERDELDQLILARIPPSYYRHQKAPEHRFTFAHGSYLRNISADDPMVLKQGKVDFLLYNEPQKMSPTAIKHGMFGTSDHAGLTVLAANPPSPGESEWLIDLKESIEEDPEIKQITRFFNFDSKLNTKIDQPSRRRVAKLARVIDPSGVEADADGKWMRWGDLAYPSFNHRSVDRGGLVGPIPQLGSADLTPATTKRMFGHAYSLVIGGDFQRRPQAAAVLKIFDSADGPIYWFVADMGAKGTEVELSDSLMGLECGLSGESLQPDSAIWIGDASGSWQGAERVKGRTSFTLLQEQGWRIEPPELIRRIGKSDHAKNPDVMQRLGLMQRLMEGRRIRVDPRCSWLIEAFSKCQLRKTEYGKRVPKGQWAHVTDAACYPIWRLEPKPKTTKPAGPTPRGGSFPSLRPGANFRM